MFWKEIFYLQKSDRKILSVLVILIAASVVILFFIGGKNTKTTFPSSDTSQLKSDLTRNRYSKEKRPLYYAVASKKKELSQFDPNTADSTQLLRLGLSPWQVRNIYKYRAKGGIYRDASDFAKIYGLTKGQYDMLKPYIHISDKFLPVPKSSLAKPRTDSVCKYPVKLKQSERIVLNDADTDALKKIPGIGPVFARSIVNYRNRLGGFCSVEQLKEIADFPEEAIKYVVIQKSDVKKINVNKLTLAQLRRHPYINFYQAKDIVDYRRLHGKIQSIHDLWLLKDFPPEEIKRLEPYVEY